MKKSKKEILEETLAAMPEIQFWGELTNSPGLYEVNFKKGPTNYFLTQKEFNKALKLHPVESFPLAVYHAIYMEIEKERERCEGFLDKMTEKYFPEKP